MPTRLYFLNRGLQTLQFYNVSVDPRAPLQRLMGGLQDNGTIWIDGTGSPNVWKSAFPLGDGTSASGFHPSRPGVLFASFQSSEFFVNFANGDLSRWVRIGDPMRAANERATITASTGRQFMSFDEVNPDTQFTGFQHVWRTKNNGGNQATLEASCRSLFAAPSACGDWVPLGISFPFAAGSTPDSASRRPGDLTADAFGSDRTGGIIVSSERSALDAGTLWAATSTGRLFVSKNADAAGPDVTFTRIDTPVTPNRFVTRIIPDRTDVNAAFVSYSAFNALTPSSPGHVFRMVFNPSSRIAGFTLLDGDLGDLPINTLAVDDVKGDVYAGTDFGPLVLRKGSSAVALAGVGFPEALMVDLRYCRHNACSSPPRTGWGFSTCGWISRDRRVTEGTKKNTTATRDTEMNWFLFRLQKCCVSVALWFAFLRALRYLRRLCLDQNRRAIATLTIVLARTPPLNTSTSLSAGPLSDETRPVAGSLLNWIAGFVNDSMKPAGVPRATEGVASRWTRVVSGPMSMRASARKDHGREKSWRRPPPSTATRDFGRVNSTLTESVSSIGTSPRIDVV